jgi:hypothetical protein
MDSKLIVNIVFETVLKSVSVYFKTLYQYFSEFAKKNHEENQSRHWSISRYIYRTLIYVIINLEKWINFCLVSDIYNVIKLDLIYCLEYNDKPDCCPLF